MHKEYFEVDSGFAEWASGYGGISGGNPDSDLWFCGIEYGGINRLDDVGSFGSLHIGPDNIPSWDDKFIEYYRHECTTWPYIQKIAKVAMAYEGRDIQSYRDYILNDLCRSQGSTFLMNLYPCNFPTTYHGFWKKEVFEKTGFPNKELYIAWCMQNRFPRLADIVRKHEPRVLICTGMGFKSHFQLAFLNKEQIFQDGKVIGLGKKECIIYPILGKRTKVLITPFFGQGGVMADADLIKIAEIAKNIEEL